MFGKKNHDSYDDYNEKYASKYDDDYIAPSQDYRKECDHSHEQTYKNMNDIWECGHSHEQAYPNINEVRECDHKHEQTYPDADTDQRPYDSYASLESRFQPYLIMNEHLIWVGGYDSISPKLPAEAKADKNRYAIMIIISLALTIFGIKVCALGCIGIIMFVLTVIGATGGFNNGIYAITDMRVINIKNGRPFFTALTDIKGVYTVTGRKNAGYVIYSTIHPVYQGQTMQKDGYDSVITGISDPQRVKRILEDAIHGAKMNNSN